MKYPKTQFDKLVTILTEMNKHFTNLQEVNYNNLAYIAYQQVCPRQRHNSFVVLEDGTLCKRHFAVTKGLSYDDFFQEDESFKLYPNNTNDANLETAVKKALKLINNN